MVFDGLVRCGCLEALDCREAMDLLEDLHLGPIVERKAKDFS
jgi:hypothetical protein